LRASIVRFVVMLDSGINHIALGDIAEAQADEGEE
jgi:hypothetical protein